MFKLNRKEFLKELSALQLVMEKKGTIPILGSVKIECDEVCRLTATDLDATLVVQIPFQGEPWAGCVPLRKLLSLIKLLENEEVQFSEKPNNRLEISGNRSKHLLPFEPESTFPETVLPKAEETSLDAKSLSEMIKATSFWIRANSDHLNGFERQQTGLSVRSNGESVEVMAFKGSAAAIATLASPHPAFSFILPRQAAAALGRFDEIVQVVWDKDRASFIGENRTLTTRLMEGEFPLWKTFLPEYEHNVSLPLLELWGAVQRATITAGAAQGFFPQLKLTLAKKFIKIESLGDGGQSEETIPVESTLNGKEIVMGINGDQVLEALGAANGDVVCEFAAADQPLIFAVFSNAFDLRYLTTPCRLNF